MTTWYNTWAIIHYLNYYLRDLPLPRDKFGYIAQTPSSGIYVSGDD